MDGEKLQTNDSRLKYFASTPIGFSLFLNKRRIEREAKEREERQRIETQRKTNNLCLHCGGRFEGFFIKNVADVNVLRITNFETLFWLNMIMRKFVAIVDDVLKSSGC